MCELLARAFAEVGKFGRARRLPALFKNTQGLGTQLVAFRLVGQNLVQRFGVAESAKRADRGAANRFVFIVGERNRQRSRAAFDVAAGQSLGGGGARGRRGRGKQIHHPCRHFGAVARPGRRDWRRRRLRC